MPGIDLSRYENKKKAKPADQPSDGGLLTLLNKDISFGGNAMNDKKKEAFYLELGSLLQAGINLKSSLELITADQEKEKDRTLFKQVQDQVLKGSDLSAAIGHSGKFS